MIQNSIMNFNIISSALLSCCCYFAVFVLIIIATSTTTTRALAPPDPNWNDYESVHGMRRRLNIQYDYQPKHINDEYCRYLTSHQCREEDEIVNEAVLFGRDHQRPTVITTSETGVKTITKGPVGEYYDAIRTISNENEINNDSHDSISNLTQRVHHKNMRRYYKNKLHQSLRDYIKPRKLNPTIGTRIRVLVLLVKFKGHENRAVPPRDYFDTLFNGDGVSVINPIGSVKEWLRFSSMGKYRVVFDVKDWEMSNQTETQTAIGKSGLIGASKIQTFFTSVLTKLDPTINWVDGFYVDEFGYLNHLVVLHSGFGAEYGPLTCSSIVDERDPKNRVWSQGSSSVGSAGWTSKDFFQLNGFAVTSAFDAPGCDATTNTLRDPINAKMGMALHEISHGFKLPDLYDQDRDEPNDVMVLGGASKLAVMATGTGWVRDASKPGHHDAWSRIQLGWVDPIVITKNGYYAIQASEISGHIYKISKNFPSGEYLLIENRQPIKWDSDLPKNQSAGIVIWHIDENADGQRTRGYPGHPNWPLEHYMVSMVQADGKYDIERAVNLGDTGDFWKNGQSLGPGGSDPNTDSYRFGERRSTGLKITITSDPGFIMTFQVEGINGTIRSADRTSRGGNTSDPQSTMSTVRWILSMLLGAAALIGVLAIILV